MKPNFGKFFVLVLLIAFLSASSASQTRAQTPAPPGIMENDVIPQDLYVNDQAISERGLEAVDGGENGITAASSYWSISGATFVPNTSTVTYVSGSLCVDTGNDGDFWLANVDLPHGSTIVGMYFNYYNDVTDPPNSAITLSRFQYDGTYDDILSISGSNTVIGHRSTYTNEVANAVVDNLNYSYVLFWTGMTQQRLCGVNLVYTPPPIFFNVLPLINR